MNPVDPATGMSATTARMYNAAARLRFDATHPPRGGLTNDCVPAGAGARPHRRPSEGHYRHPGSLRAGGVDARARLALIEASARCGVIGLEGSMYTQLFGNT